jgi:hypothetical protein
VGISAQVLDEVWGTKLYIVVLAGRPNVFSAVGDYEGGVLYLSNEAYTYATNSLGEYVRQVSQVQLLDASRQPLTDWVDFSLRMPMTDDVAFVTYRGASGLETVTQVTPLNEYAELDTVTVVSTASEAVSDIVAEAVIAEAETAAVSSPLVSSEVVFSAEPEVTEVVTAPNASSPLSEIVVVSQIQPGSSASAAVVSDAAETAAVVVDEGDIALQLVYDDRALTVTNASDQPIDVSQVSIGGAGSALTIDRWERLTDGVDASALQPGQCLRVQSWFDADAYEEPVDCRGVRAVLSIAPERMFWMQGVFTINVNDVPVLECDPASATCSVPAALTG